MEGATPVWRCDGTNLVDLFTHTRVSLAKDQRPNLVSTSVYIALQQSVWSVVLQLSRQLIWGLRLHTTRHQIGNPLDYGTIFMFAFTTYDIAVNDETACYKCPDRVRRIAFPRCELCIEPRTKQL